MRMYTDSDLKLFEENKEQLEKKLLERENEILYPTMKTKKAMVDIVRQFVKDKKRKIYGGTAQNELIKVKNPEDKFYPDDHLADLDFYSPSPIEDAIELANILIDKGYNYVTAREAFHSETYTVFAEWEPVADISFIN